MERSVREIAELVQAHVVGDVETQISGIASIASAKPGDLVFVEDEKNLDAALRSRAAAIITGNFAQDRSEKPLLIARYPRLAFARAARILIPPKERKPGIHPSAVVHPTVRLGAEVCVAERVVIREGARIGDATCIGAGCVISDGVSIGRNCELYPNVTVYSRVQIGNGVTIHAGSVLGSDGFGYVRDESTGHYENFPQVGRLVIEDDVEIGANSTVDRGALDETRIRRGAKIDNLVHVGHNCDIGEDVVIAAQTGLSGSAVIENNAILGGQVGIADHVRIEQGAILGAQSGVPSRKVIRGAGVVFWGTPARPIREYLKQLAALVRLSKRG